MFVVFEGIDGGGKTTLSNLVASLLRERGLVVEHVREGGKFASAVTQAMRELGRDARNLALTPRAELLLYLTREVQLAEEATRPALRRADVVIADRYMYTAETLAVAGRAMLQDEVTALVTAAANGLWPELVVLVDVDRHVARARRRVSKLLTPDAKPPSRKGLAGTALQHRLRDGYRALAARDPARWLVVDNTEADLQQMAVALADMIGAGRADGVPAALGRMVHPPTPVALRGDDLERARTALLAWIDRRSTREPALAAYFLGGLGGPGLDERRRALAPRAPAVVADGLRWLHDAAAWQLRHELATLAPEQVARSLVGRAAEHADAPALLETLLTLAPAGVSSALVGRDDEPAWALRARLPADLAARSLCGVPGERAEAMRDRWLAGRGGLEGIEDVATAALACKAVESVGDDRAWAIRRRLRDVAPVAALDSTYLLEDDRSWKWRERAIERAPKIVMRTIGLSLDPRAWALRERVIGHCEETLDSLVGLDTALAWKLREAARDHWPASAVKSLGTLGATERGRLFVASALAHAPHDVALWRHALIVTGGGSEPTQW